MKIVDRALDIFTGMAAGASIGGQVLSDLPLRMQEAVMQAQLEGEQPVGKALLWNVAEAASLVELEIALDNQGWRETTGGGLWNFSRAAIDKMIALSRVMYLVNPLIKRIVTVQELYVWGAGCTIKASKSDIVQEVLDDFYQDPKNQAVIGENWPEREREQRIDGNTFLIFFFNRLTGVARVRLIPISQISEIICNPEDSKEPWFYKRVIPTSDLANERTVYYPDIDYTPRAAAAKLIDGRVEWDTKILHIKTGGLSSMLFGMPELFSALNWATAYKRILENFATILAAYARIAMKISGNPGKKGTAGAKSTMNTTIEGLGGGRETNPPKNTGAIIATSGNVDISAVKTAHSTTGPDEARALRSMVAAGGDTPEHFFGDSDMGNFATSKTLDRPTELKMISRQKMWSDVIQHINRFLIELSAKAPQGKLRVAGWRAELVQDAFDRAVEYKVIPPSDQSAAVSVVFPPVLESDMPDRVAAAVKAITLGGAKAEGIIPDRKFAFRLIMVALGQKNVDELCDEMYPASTRQGFVDPAEELKIKKIAAEKPVSTPQPAKKKKV